jgi:hypothetical protein
MSARIRVGRTGVRPNPTEEQSEDLVPTVSESSVEQVERHGKALREQVEPEGPASQGDKLEQPNELEEL